MKWTFTNESTTQPITKRDSNKAFIRESQIMLIGHELFSKCIFFGFCNNSVQNLIGNCWWLKIYFQLATEHFESCALSSTNLFCASVNYWLCFYEIPSSFFHIVWVKTIIQNTSIIPETILDGVYFVFIWCELPISVGNRLQAIAESAQVLFSIDFSQSLEYYSIIHFEYLNEFSVFH